MFVEICRYSASFYYKVGVAEEAQRHYHGAFFFVVIYRCSWKCVDVLPLSARGRPELFVHSCIIK